MKEKIIVLTSRAVLLLDCDQHTTQVFHEGSGTYYGIAETETSFVIGARNYKNNFFSIRDKTSERPKLLYLTKGLKLVKEVNFPVRAFGLHQIFHFEGQLFCTCSESNSIVIYNGQNWTVWYPSSDHDSINRDVNHYNSVYVDKAHIYLLAHNLGLSAIEIYCSLTRKLIKVIKMGFKAHNIFWHEGQIATCSSGDGRIISQQETFAQVDGFPRGIVATENKYYVGVSDKTNRANRSKTDSFVEVFNSKNWRSLEKIYLGPFGQVTDLYITGL